MRRSETSNETLTTEQNEDETTEVVILADNDNDDDEIQITTSENLLTVTEKSESESTTETAKTNVNPLPHFIAQYLPTIQRALLNLMQAATAAATASTTTELPIQSSSSVPVISRESSDLVKAQELLKVEALRAIAILLSEMKRRRDAESNATSSVVSKPMEVADAATMESQNVPTHVHYEFNGNDNDYNHGGKVKAYDSDAKVFVYIDKDDLLEETSHVRMQKKILSQKDFNESSSILLCSKNINERK
jgi:hypothetical protein